MTEIERRQETYRAAKKVADAVWEVEAKVYEAYSAIAALAREADRVRNAAEEEYKAAKPRRSI